MVGLSAPALCETTADLQPGRNRLSRLPASFALTGGTDVGPMLPLPSSLCGLEEPGVARGPSPRGPQSQLQINHCAHKLLHLVKNTLQCD